VAGSPTGRRENRVRIVEFYKILAFPSGAGWRAGDIVLYAWAPQPN
jgi:hypothetical protein